MTDTERVESLYVLLDLIQDMKEKGATEHEQSAVKLAAVVVISEFKTNAISPELQVDES